MFTDHKSSIKRILQFVILTLINNILSGSKTLQKTMHMKNLEKKVFLKMHSLHIRILRLHKIHNQET